MWIKALIFSIVISALFLGVLGTGAFNPDLPWVFYTCLFLILTIGLIHGCNDLYLLKHKALDGLPNIAIKLIVYIAIISIMVFLLFFTREIGILFFLILSAYHFGGKLLSGLLMAKGFAAYAIYLLYGINLFTLMFIGSYEQLYFVLEHFHLSNISFEILRGGTLILLIMTLVILLSYFSFRRLTFPNFILVVGILLLVLSASLLTNLLISFTLVFVFFHSLPSLVSQIQAIQKDKFSNKLFIYLKQSAGIYLISIGILGIGYYFRENFQSEDLILFLLAATTIPHIALMALQKAVPQKFLFRNGKVGVMEF
ncbi:Brp/Blh family beta-carotene 15,15'-dioxygenase [Aequorivita echinoideorum]|uniref:Brp/Blh family beta-carotene 15,15'-dioxygenase n=1 Tax=Aequorivita echinoideorum TaxID=1549647 RepID=A0ABS5S2E7_9FLAO|nr:Brp/Blh family beta-carotene 15,15'-dioxygenase [Aequorivita echinoideorum]MBT0607363.1 Brp/Blh family beta-carotene 15,15'-dioxygenase [Aequorivita echinoideorum]